MLEYVRVTFRGDCLKQNISFGHGKIVNIYIVYEIDDHHAITIYPTLENALFGSLKLTKHIKCWSVQIFRKSRQVR